MSKVVQRRLGRRIGKKNFGNARSVRKMFESAVSAAKRRMLLKDMQAELLIEDILGLEPTEENLPNFRAALVSTQASTVAVHKRK